MIYPTDYADPYEGLPTEPEDYINRRCQPIERSRVHEIMENELRCVQRASNYCCNRECEKCDLLMDTDEIINAYGYVILMLEKPKPDYDDAISREAVHKLRKYVWVGGTQTVSLDDIDELPPVTPSRPKGNWERIDGCMSDRRCSNCREQISYEKIGRFCIKWGG